MPDHIVLILSTAHLGRLQSMCFATQHPLLIRVCAALNREAVGDLFIADIPSNDYLDLVILVERTLTGSPLLHRLYEVGELQVEAFHSHVRNHRNTVTAKSI